ncbi:MAG: hypothetical protein R3B84_12425 [Zavarzinella sp.]
MRLFGTLCLLVVVAGLMPHTHAQNKTITPESINQNISTYQQERAEALQKKFPEAALAKSDQLVEAAQQTIKSGSLDKAAKLVRDARWLVPYVPKNLPANVERVLGVSRFRHGGAVNALAYSSNGARLATASSDGTVRIWDLGNGRELLSYRGGSLPVLSLSWTRDDKWIASTVGNEIHIWEAETGKKVHTLTGHEGEITSVAFQPDNNNRLVSGSKDTSVRYWDVENEKLIANLNDDFAKPAKSEIYSVTFSPNSKLIASLNKNGQMHIWNPSLPAAKRFLSGFEAHARYAANQVVFGKDTSTIFSIGDDKKVKKFIGLGPDGEHIQGHGRPTVMEGHTEGGKGIAISPDANLLLSASKDYTIRLWNVGTGKQIRVYNGHTDAVNAVAISPDGSQFASGSEDGSIRLWDLRVEDPADIYKEHQGYVWSAAISNDGLIASVGADKAVYVRSKEGKVLHRFTDHTSPVMCLAFRNDGKQLATAGGDKVIRLWDLTTGKAAKVIAAHSGPITSLSYSEDGQLMLSGSTDKTAKLWDLAKDAPLVVFPAMKAPISAVALRPDAKQCAISTANGELRIYAINGTMIQETDKSTPHLPDVGGIAYSHNGKFFATCGGDGVVKYYVVNATNFSLLQEFKEHQKQVSSIAFSKDDRFLVSAGADLVIRVWDLTKRIEIRSLRGHTDWVSTVDFGPNDQSIISASVDRTMRVWELSGTETAKPIGHSKAITTVVMSADGRWVASGSEDKSIKIWDALAGVETATLPGGHSDSVYTLGFAPDGKTLVSGGGDQSLIIWDLENRSVKYRIAVGDNLNFLTYGTGGKKFVVWQTFSRGQNDDINNLQLYDVDGKKLEVLVEKNTLVQCVAFSPDAELAVMGFPNGTVRAWNIAKNERLGSDWPAFKETLVDVGISPDKNIIMAADLNCNIKVYDLAKKAELHSFKGHEAPMRALVVGPDGNRFITIDSTGEIKLWDTKTGKELRQWKLPTPVNTAAFSANGKKIITANTDSTLYVLTNP